MSRSVLKGIFRKKNRFISHWNIMQNWLNTSKNEEVERMNKKVNKKSNLETKKKLKDVEISHHIFEKRKQRNTDVCALRPKTTSA